MRRVPMHIKFGIVPVLFDLMGKCEFAISTGVQSGDVIAAPAQQGRTGSPVIQVLGFTGWTLGRFPEIGIVPFFDQSQEIVLFHG
ncbi:MAG: hypothetical protein WC824_14680 [Bacteroidota bacterium]|jgi:hypothetical protein